jgi:hypothetical protein
MITESPIRHPDESSSVIVRRALRRSSNVPPSLIGNGGLCRPSLPESEADRARARFPADAGEVRAPQVPSTANQANIVTN